MPNCTGSTYFKELSHYRKGGNITLSMPWPVAHRNIVCRTSGLCDEKNKAILCVVKSIHDDTFFGTKVPEPLSGYVRMQIMRGYHYFQYLGENKTRYVSIFNTDPDLAFIPDWLVNMVTSSVCYKQLDIM